MSTKNIFYNQVSQSVKFAMQYDVNNIINQIDKSPNRVYIEASNFYPASSTNYKIVNGKINNYDGTAQYMKSVDAVVSWNPLKAMITKDRYGFENGALSPSSILYHELIHALGMILIKSKISWDKIMITDKSPILYYNNPEEKRTTDIENLYIKYLNSQQKPRPVPYKNSYEQQTVRDNHDNGGAGAEFYNSIGVNSIQPADESKTIIGTSNTNGIGIKSYSPILKKQ